MKLVLQTCSLLKYLFFFSFQRWSNSLLFTRNVKLKDLWLLWLSIGEEQIICPHNKAVSCTLEDFQTNISGITKENNNIKENHQTSCLTGENVGLNKVGHLKVENGSFYSKQTIYS